MERCSMSFECLGASETCHMDGRNWVSVQKKGCLQNLWMSPGGCRMECLTCPTWLALWWAATAAMPWVRWIAVEAVLKLLGKHKVFTWKSKTMRKMLKSHQQADLKADLIPYNTLGPCGCVIPCRRLSFSTLAFLSGCGQAKGSAACFTQSCKSQSHRKSQTTKRRDKVFVLSDFAQCFYYSETLFMQRSCKIWWIAPRWHQVCEFRHSRESQVQQLVSETNSENRTMAPWESGLRNGSLAGCMCAGVGGVAFVKE